MSLCINPNCQQAQQEKDQGLSLFCSGCGSHLIINDCYRVERRLGEGGFGVTYLVSDAGTPKVLKILHNTEPKAIELFEQEAKVLKSLNHVGIPRVESDSPFLYEPKDHPPLHCLVMEYIEGEDLEGYMQKRNFKPLSEKAAIRWLRELVEILNVVHRANYFHRDIKPPNIMIRNSGELALIDFGTAREETHTYVQKQKGQGVTGIVSVGYTPHEQAHGKAEPRSDFFALGRTFVYLLTGKHPSEFSDSFKRGLQWQWAVQNYRRDLIHVIDQLMHPDVEDRPANTLDILQSLQNLERPLSQSSVVQQKTQQKIQPYLANPLPKQTHKIQQQAQNLQNFQEPTPAEKVSSGIFFTIFFTIVGLLAKSSNDIIMVILGFILLFLAVIIFLATIIYVITESFD